MRCRCRLYKKIDLISYVFETTLRKIDVEIFVSASIRSKFSARRHSLNQTPRRLLFDIVKFFRFE